MKKSFFKFCLLACIALFSIACMRSVKLQGNEFLIEGKISGVKDGVVVELINGNAGNGYPITSDTIKKGRFIFKEETMYGQDRLSIRLGGVPFMDADNFDLKIWVEPRAKIKIRGKRKLYHLWKVKSSIPYQKEEDIYTEKTRDIITEFSVVTAEYNEVMAKIKRASSKNEILAYGKALDPISERRDSFYKKKLFTYLDILEQTNISPVWLRKMFEVVQIMNFGLKNENDLRTKAIALYDRMTEEDKNTFWGIEITNLLLPPILVAGDNMADDDFLDVDGNTKHISDYLDSKYLLLDFWFSACGPCIAAVPEIKEISETYRDKLDIISINHDITDADWKDAMTKHGYQWINIRDPKGMGKYALNYGLMGAPCFVLISPEGKIADKWAGYANGYLKQKVSENIK